MSATVIAYLAGIVDGEGYIGIKRARRRDALSPLYHERIQVRMVEPAAVELLVETFGGTHWREKPHASGGRPLHCWQVSDARAAATLRALLPHTCASSVSRPRMLLLFAYRRKALAPTFTVALQDAACPKTS